MASLRKLHQQAFYCQPKENSIHESYKWILPTTATWQLFWVLLVGILHPAGTTTWDTSPKDEHGLSCQHIYTNRNLETNGYINLYKESPMMDKAVRFAMPSGLAHHFRHPTPTLHPAGTPNICQGTCRRWKGTGTCNVTLNMVALLPPRGKHSYRQTSTSESEVKPESLTRK